MGLGLLILWTAGVAQAQLINGSGVFQGKEKLKVSRCGGDGGFVTANVSVGSGFWTLSSGGSTFTGTLGSADSKGRKFNANFDTSSTSLLVSILTDWASSLCNAFITVTQFQFQTSQLKVNKKMDKAKVILKARGKGNSSEGPGKASYSMKLKGSFAGP